MAGVLVGAQEPAPVGRYPEPMECDPTTPPIVHRRLEPPVLFGGFGSVGEGWCG